MVRRRLFLITLLAPIVAGCHLDGNKALTKQAPVVAKNDVDVTRFIERHNENAAAVNALSANPGIVVATEGRSYRVDGMLRLEREKNFRLEITGPMRSGEVADIGSNDKGFWFWIADKKDNTIYTCDHDKVDQSPLAVTFQPEWIVEAMGLREISEREASTLSSKPGDLPGQLILTQFRTDAKGETLTKETIVDQSSGHILEQRLWSGAKTKLLARAKVSQYQQIKLNPNAESPTLVDLPSRLKLEWIAEQLSMDIKMNQTFINQDLTEYRTALFTEPKPRGSERKDLALLRVNNPRPAPSQGSTSRIHETMPPPRSGVKLGKPMSVDGDYRNPDGSSLPPLPGESASATNSVPDTVVFAPMSSGSTSAGRPATSSGNLLVR